MAAALEEVLQLALENIQTSVRLDNEVERQNCLLFAVLHVQNVLTVVNGHGQQDAGIDGNGCCAAGYSGPLRHRPIGCNNGRNRNSTGA